MRTLDRFWFRCRSARRGRFGSGSVRGVEASGPLESGTGPVQSQSRFRPGRSAYGLHPCSAAGSTNTTCRSRGKWQCRGRSQCRAVPGRCLCQCQCRCRGKWQPSRQPRPSWRDCRCQTRPGCSLQYPDPVSGPVVVGVGSPSRSSSVRVSARSWSMVRGSPARLPALAALVRAANMAWPFSAAMIALRQDIPSGRGWNITRRLSFASR